MSDKSFQSWKKKKKGLKTPRKGPSVEFHGGEVYGSELLTKFKTGARGTLKHGGSKVKSKKHVDWCHDLLKFIEEGHPEMAVVAVDAIDQMLDSDNELYAKFGADLARTSRLIPVRSILDRIALLEAKEAQKSRALSLTVTLVARLLEMDSKDRNFGRLPAKLVENMHKLCSAFSSIRTMAPLLALIDYQWFLSNVNSILESEDPKSQMDMVTKLIPEDRREGLKVALLDVLDPVKFKDLRASL